LTDNIHDVILRQIMIKLKAENLAKNYGRRKIFSGINFSLEPGQSLAVTGPNGSGKTTLLKVILGPNFQSSGEIQFFEDDSKLDFYIYCRRLSMVAPYLTFYDSLTAEENLRFISKVGGRSIGREKIDSALQSVGLGGRGADFVGAYSTGMKQRLKYAAGFIKNPDIWLIDEPTANLDPEGKKVIRDLIRSLKEKAILIIATNEEEETLLADQTINMG